MHKKNTFSLILVRSVGNFIDFTSFQKLYGWSVKRANVMLMGVWCTWQLAEDKRLLPTSFAAIWQTKFDKTPACTHANYIVSHLKSMKLRSLFIYRRHYQYCRICFSLCRFAIVWRCVYLAYHPSPKCFTSRTTFVTVVTCCLCVRATSAAAVATEFSGVESFGTSTDKCDAFDECSNAVPLLQDSWDLLLWSFCLYACVNICVFSVCHQTSLQIQTEYFSSFYI